MSRPLRPSPDVVVREVAGERLLVPVRNGAARMDFIFTANPAGSLVFSRLDGRRDAAALARIVCAEFDVEPERAAADVEAFLRALVEAGLAAPAPEEGS
jgi:hypothetical protein